MFLLNLYRLFSLCNSIYGALSVYRATRWHLSGKKRRKKPNATQGASEIAPAWVWISVLPPVSCGTSCKFANLSSVSFRVEKGPKPPLQGCPAEERPWDTVGRTALSQALAQTFHPEGGGTHRHNEWSLAYGRPWGKRRQTTGKQNCVPWAQDGWGRWEIPGRTKACLSPGTLFTSCVNPPELCSLRSGKLQVEVKAAKVSSSYQVSFKQHFRLYSSWKAKWKEP